MFRATTYGASQSSSRYGLDRRRSSRGNRTAAELDDLLPRAAILVDRDELAGRPWRAMLRAITWICGLVLVAEMGLGCASSRRDSEAATPDFAFARDPVKRTDSGVLYEDELGKHGNYPRGRYVAALILRDDVIRAALSDGEDVRAVGFRTDFGAPGRVSIRVFDCRVPSSPLVGSVEIDVTTEPRDFVAVLHAPKAGGAPCGRLDVLALHEARAESIGSVRLAGTASPPARLDELLDVSLGPWQYMGKREGELAMDDAWFENRGFDSDRAKALEYRLVLWTWNGEGSTIVASWKTKIPMAGTFLLTGMLTDRQTALEREPIEQWPGPVLAIGLRFELHPR